MKALFLSLILLPGFIVNAQENHNENIATRFEKTDARLSPHSDINYYPLTNGDYWEFIETDTTSIAGLFYDVGLNFSVTKEILIDTVLSNGLSYKKIRWNNEANSINSPSVYEYHRKDSLGNIFLFYQDNDYLLFDITANTGDTYPAHLPGYIWMVADKYNVIGFGDTLAAIDFNLLENGTILWETYTLVENFGLIFYKKNITGYQLPEGNFWGAIINGKEFGTLIVNKQQVDWSEFYPLHIGDYWVYEGESGGVPFIETHRITGDTLMLDGNIYFIKDYSSFERLDSVGQLFTWSNSIQSGTLEYTFTVTVGDTSVYPGSGNIFWRLNNKLFYNNRFELYRFLYPDLTYYGQYYNQGLGLFEWTIEGGYGILNGAYIDGNLWGDTTVTVINSDPNSDATDFVLYQNYPNPFNSTTNIKYQLKDKGYVSLKVYNMLGKDVAVLVNENQDKGTYSISYDGSNLPSGVYIYSLRVNGFVQNNKMILMK